MFKRADICYSLKRRRGFASYGQTITLTPTLTLTLTQRHLTCVGFAEKAF